MGFRFRKSIKIAPGIRLNLSKSGVSTTVGGRGAHVTFGGARGTRTTVGIPGTGLSWTETAGKGRRSSSAAPAPFQVPHVVPLEEPDAAAKRKAVAIVVAIVVTLGLALAFMHALSR